MPEVKPIPRWFAPDGPASEAVVQESDDDGKVDAGQFNQLRTLPEDWTEPEKDKQ